MMHPFTQNHGKLYGSVQWKAAQRPSLASVVIAAMSLWAQASARAQIQNDGAPATLKKLSIEQLMDIEVTSVSKRPEKLSETASAIQVITQEDIHRAGATSLPEALRLASNLQVTQKNAHDWGISARGFNTELANKLLVLIDGRTVYTPLYSGVFWDVQDYLLEDIDRIEVISGPGGTLWGANAVNGVINITTKNAHDTQGLYVETGGGSELRHFAGIRYGDKLGANTSFRLYGKYFDRDDAVLANDDGADDSWHMRQGGFRIDTEPSSANVFTFQGDVYSGVQNLSAGNSANVSGGNVSRVGGGNILGRWSHTQSPDSNMSLQAYYDRTHLSLPKPTNGFAADGILTDDLDTYDLDFQHHFRLSPRQQLVWGPGYRFTHDVVGNAPTLSFEPARLDHHLYSGFLQDKITLRDNLFLILGTKLEHNDYTGLEYEPSGRLQWNFSNDQMLWSAVSRAVRTPSRIDRDLRQPTQLPAPWPQNILSGSTDFVSEKLIAYEIGHRAQLNDQLTTSIATFYNDYRDIRSTTPGTITSPSLLTFANNLEGETYGMELSATYQPLDNWRLRGGYNLIKENLRVKAGQVDFSRALNETADPEQQVSLHSSIDLPNHLQLDMGLRWVDTLDNNDGPAAGTVPSYFEADIRVGWLVHQKLEFSVVGQNLLHDHHPEYGYPDASREEISRSILAKAARNF